MSFQLSRQQKCYGVRGTGDGDSSGGARFGAWRLQKIKAWQRAHALSIALYKLTRSYRRAGFAQLRSQLTRAAGSISTNIVEGCGAPSNKEFARYLGMSIESARPVPPLLTSATCRSSDLTIGTNHRRNIEVRKMVYGYRVKVLSDEQLPGDEDRGGTLNEDLTPPPSEGRAES